MIDPISLLVGGALLGAGWFCGRAHRKRSPMPVAPHSGCSCGHGYGSHEKDGPCRAQVERPHYYDNGSRSGFEWVPCPCLSYDGPEPLPRVWTG